MKTQNNEILNYNSDPNNKTDTMGKEFLKLLLVSVFLGGIAYLIYLAIDFLLFWKELYLNDNHIKNINGLEKQVNLDTLCITSNEIKEIEGLDNCVNLSVLNLKDNKIKEIKNLYELTNLDKLYLSGNQIEGIKGLETLQNLETLDLGDNKITKILGLEALTNLKDLWLFGNNINPELLDQLGGLDAGGCAFDAMKFVQYCLVNL